jgi:hypothetical protein
MSYSNNFLIRLCCVILMIECAFVALTGRGVIAIIQAIVGIIFSIEGFWGAVRYDSPSIKRFLIFLVFYFFVSIAISIIDLQTRNTYCVTAQDDSDMDYCFRTATLYGWLLLGLTLGLLVREKPLNMLFNPCTPGCMT